MRTRLIVIGGEFRKDPPQVLLVEHDQMISTFAPDRPDQAFNMAVLQDVELMSQHQDFGGRPRDLKQSLGTRTRRKAIAIIQRTCSD